MTAVSLPQTSRLDVLLRESAMSDLRQLQITESENEVIITGMVPSYYLKQMAQEAVRPALGGRRLRNRVRVQSHV